MRSGIPIACALLVVLAVVLASLRENERYPTSSSQRGPDTRHRATPEADETIAAPPGEKGGYTDRATLEALFGARLGERRRLPLGRGEEAKAVLSHRHPSGAVSVGFSIENEPDRTAHFTRLPSGRIEGHLLSPRSAIAYRVVSETESTPPRVERLPATELICARFEEGLLRPGLPPEPEASAPAPPEGTPDSAEPEGPYDSRPGASAVIFLNFEGETVAGTPWNTSYNNGAPIVAAPFEAPQHIHGIWETIAEDYAVYDANVTTDRAAFDEAPPSRRVMVIFTPTRNWYGSAAGGVAYLRSFGSLTNPYCWVFNRTLNGAAEAGSHEIGHTVGLSHDGTSSRAYYSGHTHGSGVSWAPIMGTGYNRTIVQFSKGEYPGANRFQDDFAVMSGYIDLLADDHGDSPGSATEILPNGDGTIFARGVIETGNDADVFRFTTEATGTVSLTVSPHPRYRNLDAGLELLDGSFAVIASSAPEGPFDASVNLPSLPPGTYYARVWGTGLGDLATGYGRYGSVGSYSLDGTYPDTPLPEPPENFSASDGTSPEFVLLSWDADSSADGYALYRNSLPAVAGAERIGEVSGTTFFEDRDGRHGTTYWYFVRSLFGMIESEPSPLDSGFRLSIPLPEPSSLSATRGSHPDGVLLSWASVAGAERYLVYRGRDGDPGGAELIGETSSTEWHDDTVSPGRSYRYFVRAENNNGDSPFSVSALGYGAAMDPRDDGFENNDDPSEATPMTAGRAPLRREWRAVAVDGDPDWYAATLPPDRSRFDLVVPYESSRGSIVVSLFDESAAPLATSTAGHRARAISHNGPPGASYLVLVEREEGSAVPYRLIWRALRADDPGLFPDLLVGPSVPPRLGEGIENRTGAGQSLNIALRAQRPRRAYLALVNRSAVPGSFTTRAAPSPRRLSVTHWRFRNGAWRPVTAALRRGGVRDSLVPFESATTQVRIRAAAAPGDRRALRALLPFRSSPSAAGAPLDRADLRITRPRGR